MPVYLVLKNDQLPDNRYTDGPIELRGEYYPRLVKACSPEDAIDKAFAPDKYRPGGERKLLVFELSTLTEFIAKPIRNYELKRTRSPKRDWLND